MAHPPDQDQDDNVTASNTAVPLSEESTAPANALSTLFKARLSRQVAFWVFLSIVIIEILILVPAAMRREREKLLELQQTAEIAWTATTQLSPAGAPPHQLLSQFDQAGPEEMTLGSAIYDAATQKLLASMGAPPELDFSQAQSAYDFHYRKGENGDWYDIAWQPPSLQGDYLVLRLDASPVQQYLNQYIRNIALLIVLISAFVTLGTMLALGRIVLLPIFNLRRDLMLAGEAIVKDRNPTETHFASRPRPNELGDVVVEFRHMVNRVTYAFQARKQAERDAQKAQLWAENQAADLATANQEITLLNEKLTDENLRISSELNIARQIQQMILPKTEELQQIQGLDIAGFMEPADEVGGDYYDVLQTHGVVTIGIGDVTGHGLESGLLMLMTQTAVRTLQEVREQDPVKFLDTLNRTIYRNVQRMNSEKNLTLSVLNYSEGRISISGQHEETLIVRANGTVEHIDTMDLGLPIGLEDDIAEFIDHTLVSLQSGDGVVLYTDGIPEAYNLAKKQYGVERLCEAVSRNWQGAAHEIQRAVIKDVRAFIGEQKVFDDITLVVLKKQ